MPRKMYNPWSEHELTVVREECAKGTPAAQIARILSRSLPSVNNKIGELRCGFTIQARETIVRPVAQYAPPQGPTLAEVYAPEASAEEADDAFLSRVLGGAQRSIEKAEAQRYARIRIASREPVALSLWSDAHVSTHGTDLHALMEYADAVARTPNMYSVGIGDWLDNPIKHKGGNVGQIADDLRFLDLLVGRFRGKLLGTTSGNHDDWSKILAGTDHLLALAKRHKIHYAPDELLWRREARYVGDPPGHIPEGFQFRAREGLRALPPHDAGCRHARCARARDVFRGSGRCRAVHERRSGGRVKYPPIPKHVNTMRGPVPIKIVDGLKDDDGDTAWGLWQLKPRRIELEKSAPLALQWTTLYHEIVHAALDDSGLGNLFTDQQQEAICDAIATARMRERFG